MILNNSAAKDYRNVLAGHNGLAYDGDGNALLDIESLSAKVNITNGTYRTLGAAQERAAMTGYKVTLTLTEVIVRSGQFFQDMVSGLNSGVMPSYTIRCTITSPYDGSEETVVYRECVPDGDIDIQNLTVGELCKRNWSFVCNQPPDLQSVFSL